MVRRLSMSDKTWLDKVALAATVYCELPDTDEAEIDRFIEFLYKAYGYVQSLEHKDIR
jgi:hypothetical protein